MMLSSPSAPSPNRSAKSHIACVLVVVEGVVLALDARVLDHAAGIGLQARHGASDVGIDFDNLLHRARLKERRRHALFYPEDYAFARCDLFLYKRMRGRGVVENARLSLWSLA
jgi:hypothetical protein